MSKVIVLCGELRSGKTTLAQSIANSVECELSQVLIIDLSDDGQRRLPMARLKKHLAPPDNLAVVCCHPEHIKRVVLKLEPLDCELQMWGLQPILYRGQNRQVTYGAIGTDRTCVHCGCTDSQACPEGCSWFETHKATNTGICSNCVGNEVTIGSDNVLMARLGEAALQAGNPKRRNIGNTIDRGLVLLRLLRSKNLHVHHRRS